MNLLNSLKKAFGIIYKVILIIVAVIYALLNLLSNIAFYETLSLIERITGINSDDYLTEGDESSLVFTTSIFDKFFTTPFFTVLTILSFVVSIIGTLILTRRRSVYFFIGLFLAFILPGENIYKGMI